VRIHEHTDDEYVLQATGDISGGKVTCEDAKSAAHQSATCMQNAEQALQAAFRQEAQAAELSLHVKLLQQSVKVLWFLIIQCYWLCH
jgi:hypothetical protein